MKRIMVVNNDTPDILELRDRLPRGIDIITASQVQARSMAKWYSVDAVILDNDANERKEAEGPATLRELRKHDATVPVIYTSFEPGWVSEEVRTAPGVSIVRTDQLPDYLSSVHGLAMREPPAKAAPEAQTSIILSYNEVTNYPCDMYGNGRLLVAAYPKSAQWEAPGVIETNLSKVCGGFQRRADRDRIRSIFVYDGRSGEDRAGNAASCLSHDFRMHVNLLACRCDWERKERLSRSRDISLFKVGCGGQYELGAIADVILGIERPETDRWLPEGLTREAILAEAEKFRV